VVRAIEVRQDTADTDIAVATVIVDRLTGLLVLFLIALVALPLERDAMPPRLTLVSALICVLGLIGGALLLLTDTPARIMAWLATRVRIPGLSHLAGILCTISRISREALGRAFLASLAFDLLLIITNYLMSYAFGLGLSLLVIAVITLIGSLLLLVPSIQGLGVREPVYVLLLGAVGIDAEEALAFSVGVYLLSLSTGLIGAIYYAIYGFIKVLRSERQGLPPLNGPGR
jgi:uncharacterized membrane protein YbhN (UPF0104 family)